MILTHDMLIWITTPMISLCLYDQIPQLSSEKLKNEIGIFGIEGGTHTYAIVWGTMLFRIKSTFKWEEDIYIYNSWFAVACYSCLISILDISKSSMYLQFIFLHCHHQDHIPVRLFYFHKNLCFYMWSVQPSVVTLNWGF